MIESSHCGIYRIMNSISESVASSQTARSKSEDEKDKGLAVKPIMQKEFDFSATGISGRTVNRLVSYQPDFRLKKAELEQTGRRYFVENLPLILDHNQVLSECSFFKTPIHLDDGSIYKEIQTVVYSNTKDIEAALRSLKDSELAFVIYHQDLGNGRLNITLSLFSNKSGETEVENMVHGFFGTGLEFFGISFSLEFDSYGDLTTVSPARWVNEKFRRNRICSSVSLAALTKIYEHLGSEKTVITSYSAEHIGTVKFYYPLNCFFRKSTSESLRAFDPRSASLTFDDIEKRQESFDGFQLHYGIFATCPDKQINLEKLLLQYQVRDALVKALENT